MKGHPIKKVIPGSIAQELEMEEGDILLSINEQPIEDIFDYQYLTNDEYIEVLIEKQNGEQWLLEVDKEYEEDLGLEFDNGLMDEYRSCQNKCMFCFIDQMPKGMRETLYFKDDDSRLSFLQGNYITLTNMSERDVERIVQYHLGPVNISVQTTNPQLRCKMLHNRFAGDALKKIDILYKGGIEMNGQIVLCRGINDKEELDRSIEDLTAYLPFMRSVSVVPAGLTKYREGLYPLAPFTKEDAIALIHQIEGWQERLYKKWGLHFIHASDEWYILAGLPFPPEEQYDGYIQLENGVGMMRLLEEEFTAALQKQDGDNKKRSVSIATGVLAYPQICSMADRMQEKFPNLKLYVYKIENHFFGEMITVSGLLTGGDIIKQLSGKALGDTLLLPCNVLRSGEDVFLDDITLTEMEKSLHVPVNIVKSSGSDFVKAVLGEDAEERRPNGKVTYIDAFGQNGEE